MIIEFDEAGTWSGEVAGSGLELRVLAGTVWVTQEADPEDHVLEVSGAFSTTHAGRVAIQSLTPALVQVEGARHAHGPHVHGPYAAAA